MLETQEQEELTTVRVQDPRLQNEGSWNSYVDYKIFLHGATSDLSRPPASRFTDQQQGLYRQDLVRAQKVPRVRVAEEAAPEKRWLSVRPMSPRSGCGDRAVFLPLLCSLRPVPELPGKSTFFAGSTDEFIEKRRQGLQQFLEKVVQNVVLLSDSQLHLFLQSQLSVPEIEACVQGQSSLTVTDAILRYAMSNCGWVQEEDTRPALVAGAELYGSCAGLGSPPVRSCLKPPSRWSDFGMEDSHSDSLDSPTEQPETE
ncbi:sorting nexin-11 isoform X2 [Mauremys mutica]|nr:sorting nexin-11 isoform X2 [Mauremys mutica]XP_044855644.1 sorting nexin-11 isoform X2 [Mauremys mutica]XP_044855646.1 sorting nexin-11 isoform X2 [Mauremys mutica]